MRGPAFLYLVDPMTTVDPTKGGMEDPRSDPASLLVRPHVNRRGRAPAVVIEDIPEELRPAPPRAEDINRSLVEALESARYHEHGFRWDANAVAAVRVGTIFEIARWRVPARHVGILDHIDTHFGLTIAISEENFLDIALDLPWQPWLHEVLGVKLRWWLRVESTRNLEEPSPVVLVDPSELPGTPFFELPTWSDQRFGYNYHGRRPLRLLVPERSTVRLFFGLEMPPEEDKAASSRSVSLDIKALYSSGALSAIGAQLPEGWSPETKALDVGSSGPSFAGRIIGTIQAYKDNPGAVEAARRGL